jgi:hypothetical protein
MKGNKSNNKSDSALLSHYKGLILDEDPGYEEELIKDGLYTLYPNANEDELEEELLSALDKILI